MHFFRYFASHAFETLRDQRLMVTTPSALNDPFEFLHKSSGQMTMTKARKYIKQHRKSNFFLNIAKQQPSNIKGKKDLKRYIDKNIEKLALEYYNSFEEVTEVSPAEHLKLVDRHFRICSMSSTDIKPHEEILLWSHYAAKHSGVRIKLNLNEKGTSPCFIRKVVYATERVGLDLTNGAETESVRRSIIEAASTKAEGWRYEAEYRLFTIPGACKIECGPDGVTRSFLEVPAEVFIGVDFGINCPQEIISQISILMKSKYPDARLRKAKQNKSNFLIDYHDL